MTDQTKPILFQPDGNIAVITINRPRVRNAVNAATAFLLAQAFHQFENDDSLHVAILTGADGTFCAGADLKEIASGRRSTVQEDGDSPMGPTWMLLSKPVLAAVEGHAVAGGLELALWCDLRIAARDAVFGVFNRCWGVPLIDLGTVRLPRLIGHGRALDLILTGRGVSGEEALEMGLVNRLVEPGTALEVAVDLARTISQFPQQCLRADRLSAYEQWSLPWEEARSNELRHGLEIINSGEAAAGASRFASGTGRHGSFSE
jgi:enoyl-CoA hydratase/carnithine racemase